MIERQTGATPEQVEAAAKRYADLTWNPWETLHPSSQELCRRTQRNSAVFLVSPDQRIVAAADLRAVLEWVDAAIGLTMYAGIDDEREAAGAVAARLREVLG